MVPSPTDCLQFARHGVQRPPFRPVRDLAVCALVSVGAYVVTAPMWRLWHGFFGWYALHSQSVLNAIDHGLTFERFAEKPFGTCRHQPFVYAFILECGDEDDGRAYTNISQDLEQLHSTNSVHLHVGYQAVDFNKPPLR